MKHFSSLRAAILGVLWLQTAPICAQNAPILAPAMAKQLATTRQIRIKNVESALMAWWLDPARNPAPLEFKNAEKTEVSLAKPFVLPIGVESLTALDAQNLLVVVATDTGFAELQKLVEFLDKPLQKIEIEAQFVEISTADSRAFRFDLKASESTPKISQPRILFPRGDFGATLTALINANRAKVLAAPRVTTMNNLPASVQIAPTHFVQIGVVTNEGKIEGLDRLTETGTNKFSVGLTTKFLVTPTVNNDGTITLLLSFSRAVQTSKAGEIETVSEQKIEGLASVANVRDGETLAFGGLEPNFSSLQKRPVLNGVFQEKTANQLLVFVTARIVHRANDETPVPGAD